MSKEVFVFLIFLFISCFFWVLQMLQGIGDIELSIPVSYSGIPERVSVTNKLPATIKVTLRDKGAGLFYYYRHPKDLAINVNLQEWYRKDSIVRIPLSSFEVSLRNRLMSSTQLLHIKPENIAVYFVEQASKTVPVRLNTTLNTAQQYLLTDEPLIFPSKIKVYAPKCVLTKLNEVKTESRLIANAKDTTTVVLSLKPIEGVRFSTKKVKVQWNVEEFTERTLEVPVRGVHFPPGEELLSFPQNVKVTFFVGLSSYSKISEKDFAVVVDCERLLRSDRTLQKVQLVQCPTNVRNIRIQPEIVECLIEKIR